MAPWERQSAIHPIAATRCVSEWSDLDSPLPHATLFAARRCSRQRHAPSGRQQQHPGIVGLNLKLDPNFRTCSTACCSSCSFNLILMMTMTMRMRTATVTTTTVTIIGEELLQGVFAMPMQAAPVNQFLHLSTPMDNRSFRYDIPTTCFVNAH